MKRYGNLWKKVISWENLVLAAKKAQRGKRGRCCVQKFNFQLEPELLRLQQELMAKEYRPGKFHTHWISKPKPRLISAAPYRDRVVHHALMNVLEPILERHFHPRSFACRKDKGTHAAANRLQELIRKKKYVLQCDIRKFFPSIDHKILKGKFPKLIKDKNVLSLMSMIVDYSNRQEIVQEWFDGDDLFGPIDRAKGLPIGNLTSQWFANWYLNDLDHFIAKEFGIGSYVRYCDDFVLLSNERIKLVTARNLIKQKLQADRLRLHKRKLFIKPTKAGLTFVGYRIWPQFRLLRKNNIKAFKRRVKWMRKAYSNGLIEWADIQPRLDSWIAHASHANSRKLIVRLSKNWSFSRAMADKQPRSSRRQLEQQSEELPVCQPQQEHARQHEQQQRVSGCGVCFVPALSKSNTRNHTVYGPYECGIESPGCSPELIRRVA